MKKFRKVFVAAVLGLYALPAPALKQLTPITPGVAINYPGVCSPRIALMVLGKGRRGEQVTPQLIDETRQSLDELVSLCPAVESVAVSITDTRTRDNTQFTMSRSNGWKIENRMTKSGLIALLEQSGYKTMAGPRPYFSVAYWRIHDGRFETLYGHDLTNRLVATHVESDGRGFRVRGQFYDTGFHESGRACETSREGYPLWGSFTMSVSADNTGLPITIKWCAEDHEPGETDTTEFTDLPSMQKKSRKTVTAMSAALTDFPGRIDIGTGDGSRELLLDRDMFRIYATKQPVCEHLEVDLVYRVNNEARESLFNGDYDDSLANTTANLLGRRCGEILKFTVNAYSVGDTTPWDSKIYRFRPNSGEIPYAGSVSYRSDAAKRYAADLRSQQFGACEGPFCEYEGGRYLNAIYNDDLAIVRQMDALHREALSEFQSQQVNAARRIAGSAGAVIMDGVASPSQVQLLPVVANKYMHAYGMWGDECLDPGAEKKSYKEVTPTIIETDEYGTRTSGGIVIETTYTTNPEFFPLRDRLATPGGANRSDNPANLAVKGAIFKGIVALTQNGDCRSPEVKQFERNLRKLTAEVMRNPGVIPPTADVRPPVPPRREKPAFAAVDNTAAQRVAWNAPAPLPVAGVAAGAVTDAAGAATAPVLQMTRQEKMQNLQKRMLALQERYQEQMAEAQRSVVEAQKRGASMSELMQMTAESQEKMREAQRQYQEEMMALQQEMY